ncbi:hypothetical protein L9F63_003483, partial [Diploptera punctata]
FSRGSLPYWRTRYYKTMSGSGKKQNMDFNFHRIMELQYVPFPPMKSIFLFTASQRMLSSVSYGLLR